MQKAMAYNKKIPMVVGERIPSDVITAVKDLGTFFVPEDDDGRFSDPLDRRLHNEARRQRIAIKTSRWAAIHPATLEAMRLIRIDLVIEQAELSALSPYRQRRSRIKVTGN